MLKWLFSKVYKKWLHNPYSDSYDTVLKVLNWRTARVMSKSGGVRTMSPCFKIFGIKFN